MQEKLKRHLLWLEAGLYCGGVVLLAVFILLRYQGERQREEGIEAFHLASDSFVREAQASPREVSLANPVTGQTLQAAVAEPDLERWAKSRIREYEQSLQVEADPPLAVMTIERVGIQVPVYDGADDFNLTRGVGRIKGTAAVGAEGNMGVAGHRDGFFRGLKDIAIGDGIYLLTLGGKEVYTVASIDIVDPEDVWVLAPSEVKTITLVTCYPFYYVGHAPKRFIVKATAEHPLAKN